MYIPYLSGSVVESPVGLVVAESGKRVNAMTISFFSEVAHYPTALWASIANSSYTHDLIVESGRFTLTVLHTGQRDLALRCGTVSGRDRDKASTLDLYRGPEGYLYLDDAIASAACRVRQAHPVGDHTLFIADILAGECESRRSISRHLLTADLLS